METVLSQLILEEHESSCTLIFALGATARKYFENDLQSSTGTISSVRAMMNARNQIKVLFLNKLRYLHMYLTKFEVNEGNEKLSFENLIIYGLDEALELDRDVLTAPQLRLANLIYNVAFKVKGRYQIEIQFVPSRQVPCDDLSRLEQYWREIG
ncbi:LAME_0G16094g1_1 [Lachancea meyersii CBS 8951]|uniref:LAME_0G16094g1_1 n=1 Tax=Lachancea meyersii CBS 8951 TaxID=1266667 RepID=A0A1G4KAY3_9SACH|nr:LAME_0G16094g1_1 [Lachancea meyersii CBS 8951]